VSSVSRTIDGGAATALTPRAGDAELTLRVVDDLRTLFGGVTGQINSLPGVATRQGSTVRVDVTFASPVVLDAGAAPYDVFMFRTADPAHEIHRPEYAGTAAMRTTMFGTADDGSTAARHFVDRNGLPFLLTVPANTAYPVEGMEITRLFTTITTFAASGGASARDFYLAPVNANAFGGGRPSLPSIVAHSVDTACLPVTTPLASSVIASATHATVDGQADRDGNSLPTTNLYDGNTNTRSRFRVGGTQGFRIQLNLASARSVSGLRIFVPPGSNAGYAGIRISTSSGGAFTTRYTDLRMFGGVGRFAGSEILGGTSFPAGHVGVQGWYDHLFATPILGVTSILIETGWNDEASDACYSMNELVVLGT
jgi:hypothetical protein